MNIKDFKVGQKVFVELTGNASSGKTAEECIEEWEITSVGKKYIKAGKLSARRGILNETTFEWKDTYKNFVEKNDCCVNYILYAKRKEIEERQEKSRLFREISEVFTRHWARTELTLEQLRKIKKILEKESTE